MQHSSENLVSLRTGDAQELQSVISANLRPAFIKARPQERQSFHFRQARLQNSFISVLSGEGGIDIRLGVDPHEAHSFIFWVQLKGTSWMSPNDKDYFAIPESHGCIASNNSAGFIRQSPHSRQFFIRFERALAEDNCAESELPLTLLDEGVPVQLPSLLGSSLQRYIYYVLTEFKEWQSPIYEAKTAQRTEQLLMALLMSRLRERASDGSRRNPEPEFVMRAERFILDKLGEEISVDDLVKAAGVSMRTLYRGFKNCKGVGPMAFLRDRQLEKAHAELLDGDPACTSVTDVAFGLGFHHLSNFAALYRNKFGCLPSDTLFKKM
ncbi:MAG: helix-turn-helix transcriptional regulator [Woeseia sp.]